ncbi:hypothetical protein JDV02_010383 [Purpureocillium takamizusanense]|uniref:Ima1 N-terminal domain-containing protein n=1 Tax=Purpureocillium takamizusanense TaxID=2060973 RepID=A0A9Q8VGK1_9HYPO|nr:uncharacterized protein JDV02_010383 [Purpureocillium takamizusanense]UNI24651.1 hypothetical protein JDV02_010383 [Purpureocillium takamizusanense]
MARLRGARYLTCFYCGKRSGLKYDGVTREFLCLYCDATNYLDENGEITDPPVATDREAITTQYAVPRPSSPAAGGSSNIFCPTCLKNQHLFTKSLAQYFPDDPSDPEYEKLERNYYRYRRGLEERYPQVCDECAARVEHRIRQAGYTAKTDHLRRMMDLSRGRKPIRRRTPLDWASALGGAIWRAGFVLQLLWHMVMVTQVLQAGDAAGMRDPDGVDSLLGQIIPWLAWIADLLPAQDVLMRWSVAAACASVWWNPHFVQVNRGFTRHLLGLTQWYSFQGLIIFFRLVFRRVEGIKGGRSQSVQAQLSIHAVMAAVMGLIYVLAGRSIRVDTSPLFGTDDKPALPKATTPAKRKQEDSKTFSELFKDALESPDGPSKARPASLTPPSQRVTGPQPPGSSALSFGGLGLSETPARRRQQPVQYAEEMDWSPITPHQNRAIVNPSSPSIGTSKFARQEVDNPFRHKVPAAPVNPARRLWNPPREPEPEVQPPVSNSQKLFAGRRTGSDRGKAVEGSHGVEFRQPKFFAPDRDDASSLADLLSQSFSLSQEQDVDTKSVDGMATNGSPSRVAASRSDKPRRRMPPTSNAALPVTVASLGLAWLATMVIAIPYQLEIRTVVLLVAGIIALSDSDATSHEIQTSPTPRTVAYVLSAVGVVELASVCWVATKVWESDVPEARVDVYGLALLGTMSARLMLRRVGIV